MKLDFNKADEIIATLTEAPRPLSSGSAFSWSKPGRTSTITVSSRFGAPKSRFMQSLIGRLGGEIAYIEAWSPGGARLSTVLFAGAAPGQQSSVYGDGRREGTAAQVADFIAAACAEDCGIVVYGGDRIRWRLSFSARGADLPPARETPIDATYREHSVLRKEF